MIVSEDMSELCHENESIQGCHGKKKYWKHLPVHSAIFMEDLL